MSKSIKKNYHKLNYFKVLLIILIFSSLISSCNSIDVFFLMKKGEVQEKEFNAKIPFEYRMGLMVITVKINNESFDFVVDTGAPNILSKELFKKLKLESEFSQSVGDSRGSSKELNFTTIEKLNIGGVNFTDIGTTVADLNENSEMRCLNIDGIIGSNLLKKAIWQFDFQKQKITLTNSLNTLNIPANSLVTSFNPDMVGEPFIDLNLNGIIHKDVVIDLGSGGGFAISKEIFKKLKHENKLSSEISAYGVKSTGIFSAGENETYHLGIVPKISIGNLNLEGQIVSTALVPTIGLQILKNYRIIFNWSEEELTFIKSQKKIKSTFDSYGYRSRLIKNKAFIGLIYKNSSADLAGLKVGDQIIEKNGEDFNHISQDKWCKIYEERLLNDFKGKILNLKILRDGNPLNFKLYHTTLLGKKNNYSL